MKTIRVYEFGAPEVMKLEEVSTPRPGPGQALVRLHAVGVNPVDTYIRKDGYSIKPALPYTPGSDAAGVVEAVGEGFEAFKPGDHVYTWGSFTGVYAEFALCGPQHLHPLPMKASFKEGAALGVPYATAYRALFQRGGAKAGETVLVHGASGGVGVAALQWARAAGLNVIGTAGTDEGRKLAAKEGAHHVLDHKSPGYLDRVRELTGGRGADLILEMLANVNLGADLPALAKKGRVVVVGSRGTVEINPRDAMSRDADVRGMVLFNADAADLKEIHAAIRAGLEDGALRPVIGKELPLKEAPRAHALVMEPGSYGKIVLIP